MTLELVLELERVGDALVNLDRRIPGDGDGVAVGRERVVRDGRVEQVVHFWRRHDAVVFVLDVWACDRSSSLLSRCRWGTWPASRLCGVLGARESSRGKC